MDRFTLNFLTFSFICSGLRVKFINPAKFPCVIAINVRRPSKRKFYTPSVSSIAGPFTKFSAPNVTNRASNSTIDTSTITWRNSFIRYRKSERYISAKKVAVHPAPSPSNMLLVRSKPSSSFHSVSRKLPGSLGTLCSRTRLIFLQHSRVNELDFHFIQSLLEDSVQPGLSFNAVKVDSIGG